MNSNTLLIGFQRGMHPKKVLGIGGYNFETLIEGSILKTKKYIGLTKDGRLANGYRSAARRIEKDQYFIIIDTYNHNDKEITFSFITINKWALENIYKGGFSNINDPLENIKYLKNIYLKNGAAEFKRNFFKLTGVWYHNVSGIMYLTKKKFENRFEIVK